MTNGSPDDEFFAAELTLPEEGLGREDFSVFLVQVKSDSEIGRQVLVDPLSVFRERIPEMGLDGETDVSVQVLRVNAEIPANPVRRSAIWVKFPGSTNLVGIEYKYPPKS